MIIAPGAAQAIADKATSAFLKDEIGAGQLDRIIESVRRQAEVN